MSDFATRFLSPLLIAYITVRDLTGILLILLADWVSIGVLWFGSDDWVIDQINSEATRTPMPSPMPTADYTG